jgi:HTH-type transcriptional regulator / antitoxin HigA
MKIKVIKTETDYNSAVERIYSLINSEEEPIKAGTAKGDELELLAILVERYEQENFPVSAPDPIEAIRFRMEQMALKQKDIAPLFGGETRASEVLNGKRDLTLKMITMLNRYLDIPFESLMRGNKKIKLESERKREIFKVPVLKEFLAKRNIAIL